MNTDNFHHVAMTAHDVVWSAGTPGAVVLTVLVVLLVRSFMV